MLVENDVPLDMDFDGSLGESGKREGIGSIYGVEVEQVGEFIHKSSEWNLVNLQPRNLSV